MHIGSRASQVYIHPISSLAFFFFFIFLISTPVLKDTFLRAPCILGDLLRDVLHWTPGLPPVYINQKTREDILFSVFHLALSLYEILSV